MATLILSCSTGQGHNSCANAIKEFYEQQGEYCIVEDALNFISKSFSDFICWGHTTIYRHLHGLFQFGYRYSEKHPAMFEADSGIYKLLAVGAERIGQFIRVRNFDTVICTHVFSSLMMTEVQKKYHLPIVTSLVATDYTCNPGTKESIVDCHFIPDRPLSVYYTCPTIAESQIISCGIPILQEFYTHTSSEKAKSAFGIPVDHKHLIMMCGSMGCGPMEKLAKLLSCRLTKKSDLSIICGTNRSVQKKLSAQYAGCENIHVLGYVKDMSVLMDSADLFLTKPGGISVTEAAAKNLPMVFIDAVAGCEEYNKIYFIRKGAAVTGTNIKDLAAICIHLLSDPLALDSMRKNLEACEKQNAASIIYHKMKKLSENIAYDSVYPSC